MNRVIISGELLAFGSNHMTVRVKNKYGDPSKEYVNIDICIGPEITQKIPHILGTNLLIIGDLAWDHELYIVANDIVVRGA